MESMKPCPYCAEQIRSEAIYCRYCRTRLTEFESVAWHRSHPDARWGGVCAALAYAFALPVGAVRVAFVLFSIFLHVGPFVYLGLWLLIPPGPGEPSLIERGLRWMLDMIGSRQPDGPVSYGRQSPMADEPKVARGSVD